MSAASFSRNLWGLVTPGTIPSQVVLRECLINRNLRRLEVWSSMIIGVIFANISSPLVGECGNAGHMPTQASLLTWLSPVRMCFGSVLFAQSIEP